ncbi:MAG TPA: alcohol dehydrogenase catalytic domain-containing protein [Candidatus Binatia bacterium]|nr:alcohol dehydrogenase catalytic domain-containing protein [Candidatus Binatia bacterium]
MKALLCTSPGTVEWREVPTPRIEDDAHAIVRPLAVARCDVDLLFAMGMIQPGRPFALGHECIAEVVEIGDGVRSVAPGDVVAVPFQINCGLCGACRRGLTACCESVPFRSSYGMPLTEKDWGGALADFLLVPFADAMLVPAPSGVPATVACGAGDNIADGWRTVAPYLAERPGASVLVVGTGHTAVGLYSVDIALALGARRVDYLAPDGPALAMAEKLGARAIQSPYEGRHGPYEITSNATVDADALKLALASTAPGGVCTNQGPFSAGDVPLPVTAMYTRGVTFETSRVQSRAALPAVLELLERDCLHVADITTRTVEWSEVDDAWLEPSVKLIARHAGVA